MLVSGSADGSVRVWSLLRLNLSLFSFFLFLKSIKLLLLPLFLLFCSFRLFDDLQRQQQGSTLYEHDFNEHTTSVTDIVIDYGGCNAFIVSSSEDGTCKVVTCLIFMHLLNCN